MKKLTTLFIVAVLGPSLVLAWLAVRSLADQEMVMRDQVERRAQDMTTTVAQDVNVFMDDVRLFYRQQVDDLVRQNDNRSDTTWLQGFDQSIRSRWGQVKVGCVIAEGGKLYSPESKSQDLRVENFLKANNNFFNNRAVWEVYRAPARQSNDLLAVQAESSDKQVSSSSSWKFIESAASSPVAIPSMEKKGASALPPGPQAPSPTKAKMQKAGKKTRATKTQNDVSPMQVNVAPQNSKLNVAPQVSKLRSQAPVPNQSVGMTLQQQQKAMAVNKEALMDSIALASATEAEVVQQDESLGLGKRKDLLSVEGVAKKAALNQLQVSGQFANLETDSGVMQEVIGKEREGALGRFLEDGLHLYLWYRPQVLDSKIFWVELDLKEIRQGVQGIIEGATFAGSEGFCLALLDDEGGLIGKNRESYEGDWSKSLVSTEVGSILPRWQVAAYLINPKELMLSARNLRLTMLLLVAVLIIAIGIGGWLIIKVTSREMYLARQKTDFVSNVSHELRTPLTSIRMFSELLGRVGEVDDAKRVEYAGIIDSETGRLTRLINQLLDFSKMERGGKRFEFEALPVVSLVSETVENYRHSLEADGGTLIFHQGTETENLQVKGDSDALSQIVLNLLSNAEKYGGASPEIEVEVEAVSAEASIEIRVKDRGAGIDRREVAKIFDKFYRVDDSLASGIEGSGLGLSLARQLARAHDGELSYRRRPGGGSCFVLSLPVLQSVEQC
ncbi:MAG: HAMP domain-containing sensor histidine kinase [Verrucomicrobiota bacterium]